MLLGTDRYGNTAWHMAECMNSPETLQKVWECSKEILTKEDLTKLLLGTDQYGNTAWHQATNWGRLEALQKTWECAK